MLRICFLDVVTKYIFFLPQEFYSYCKKNTLVRRENILAVRKKMLCLTRKHFLGIKNTSVRKKQV